MKNIWHALVLLTGMMVVSCNADRRNRDTADSLLTDTEIMDTSSVDSVLAVDSAVRGDTVVDSPSIHEKSPR